MGACRQETKSSHAVNKRAEEGSELETLLSGTTDEVKKMKVD